MVTVLEQTGMAIISPLFKLWYSFIGALPGLVGALLILIIGYVVALIVEIAVRKLIDKTHIIQWIVKQTKTTKLLGKVKMSYFFGQIVKWYVFILFLNPAAEVTNLNALSQFFVGLAIWIPSLIAAIVIGFIGFIASIYIEDAIKATKAAGASIIAEVLKIIVLVFTSIIALGQLGINVSVAQDSFLIILSGVVFAASLALGIGFGLGMKDDAKAIVKDFRKKL